MARPAHARIGAVVLLVAAVGLCLVLASLSLGLPLKAACVGWDACRQTLSSPWSRVAGVPVSLPAAALYAAMVLELLRPRFGAAGYAVAAATVFGSIAWFVGVLALELRAFCSLCLATHVCGLAGTALGWRACADANRPPGVRIGHLALGALPVALLVGIQTLFPGTGSTTVTLPSSLAPAAVARAAALAPPGFGDPNAAHRITTLIEFGCDHCREHVRILRRLVDASPARVRVTLLPLGLNRRCHPELEADDDVGGGSCEYSRLAYAMWRADPERFGALVDWLSHETSPPASRDPSRVQRAFDHAVTLTDATRLRQAWESREVQRDLAASHALYADHRRRTGRRDLPQTLAGGRLRFGAFASIGEANAWLRE